MTPAPLRVIVRPEAEADITEAAVWYEDRKDGLGIALLTEVESAINRAAAHPRRFPCIRRRPEVRRVLADRFPYRVFYIRRSDAIVIIRVLHGAQSDSHWQSAADRS